jgi:MHS family shikimate/dehydroshikimate transporter-like MFS transporter
MSETQVSTRNSPIVQVAAASLIGTSIEWYDFFIYGSAAALVFPTLFFPKSDVFVGLLYSYAIFWIGFLGRPIGGLIFGHYGDKIGRKTMLVLTLVIMGLATTLIGVLPTFSQVGLLGALMLLVLRLCQGIAVGGEWGGAVLMATEHAPSRLRGFFGSWPQIGVPVGLILANVIFSVLTTSMRVGEKLSADFFAYGWRIPFLLSIILVGVGLFVRLRITETPDFERVKQTASIVAMPIITVITRNWRTILLAGGAFFLVNGSFYLYVTQIVSYGAGPTSVLKLAPAVFFNAILVAAVISLVTLPLAGWLSDRVGRRPVFLTGALLTFLLAFPIYMLIDTKSPLLITLALCIAQFFLSMMYGPQAAMFSEMFGANVRYSGASIGYQGVTIFAGGLAPFIATFLLKFSGEHSWILSLYLMAMAAITLVSIYLIAETRPTATAELAGGTTGN